MNNLTADMARHTSV